MSDYNLRSFILLTTRAYPENPRYIWYGVGQWDGHIMDWAGCNFHHGRLRFTALDREMTSPVFDTVDDALDWLIKHFDALDSTQRGHHSGEHECSKGCDDRKVGGGGWLYSTTILDELDRRRTGKRSRKPRTMQTIKDWLARDARSAKRRDPKGVYG